MGMQILNSNAGVTEQPQVFVKALLFHGGHWRLDRRASYTLNYHWNRLLISLLFWKEFHESTPNIDKEKCDKRDTHTMDFLILTPFFITAGTRCHCWEFQGTVYLLKQEWKHEKKKLDKGGINGIKKKTDKNSFLFYSRSSE